MKLKKSMCLGLSCLNILIYPVKAQTNSKQQHAIIRHIITPAVAGAIVGGGVGYMLFKYLKNKNSNNDYTNDLENKNSNNDYANDLENKNSNNDYVNNLENVSINNLEDFKKILIYFENLINNIESGFKEDKNFYKKVDNSLRYSFRNIMENLQTHLPANEECNSAITSLSDVIYKGGDLQQNRTYRKNLKREMYNVINSLTKSNTSENTLEFTCKGKNVYCVLQLAIPLTHSMDIEDLSKKLKNLIEAKCKSGDMTGPVKDSADAVGGWEESPEVYFFSKESINQYAESTMWDNIENDAKQKLYLIINLMYNHINDAKWHDIICNSLDALWCHQGHCSARATSIINTTFSNIEEFMRNNTTKLNGNYSIEERFISSLKYKIKSEATQKTYQFFENNNELVYPMLRFEFLFDKELGIPTNSSYHISRDEETLAKNILKNILNYNQLISFFQKTYNDSFSKTDILTKAEKIELTFEEYCRYSTKSDLDIAIFKQKIEDSYYESNADLDTIKKISNWVKNHESKLSVNDIYGVIEYLYSNDVMNDNQICNLNTNNNILCEYNNPEGFKLAMFLMKEDYLKK